jgi:signal transduction histidine kinase
VPIKASIFRTTAFKLVALYLLIFALSVGAILGYVFWNTAVLLERQAEETIRSEVQALADQYRLRGLGGVVDIIERRSADQTGSIYLLENARGQRVAGNLADMPPNAVGDGTWVDFPITLGKGPNQIRHTGHAYHIELSGGFRLLVGRDVEELRTFRHLIQNTLLWALGLTLALGLLGGYFTSRNFLRRVDAITDASRTIMEGDLSQRMPVNGSNDELDRLSTSLNEMLGQIERLMVGMKEVSSNVAHDLRTPLTRLRARTEAALRSANPDEHRVALQQTIAESDHLLSTFNALLSIARAEAGQSREGLAETDVSKILTDVAELYEPMVEDIGGMLTCDAPMSLPVRADRQLLAQAFSNLVDNAMKYGEDPASNAITIMMSARRSEDGSSAIITIGDKGRGVSEKDYSRMQDRFVRLDESRTKPGNGLGLSLVASVMKLHGGALKFANAGPGLAAILEIPLLHPQK